MSTTDKSARDLILPLYPGCKSLAEAMKEHARRDPNEQFRDEQEFASHVLREHFALIKKNISVLKTSTELLNYFVDFLRDNGHLEFVSDIQMRMIKTVLESKMTTLSSPLHTNVRLWSKKRVFLSNEAMWPLTISALFCFAECSMKRFHNEEMAQNFSDAAHFLLQCFVSSVSITLSRGFSHILCRNALNPLNLL